MKLSGPGLILLLVSLASASAQLTVEITLEQSQFLPDESVPAAVRITNRSGRPLRLGTDNEWLSFNIETSGGVVVSRNVDVPVAGEFLLESSMVATKRVDLGPAFSLSQPGRYSVAATVRIKAWNYEVSSPPATFDLVSGAQLWSQEVGVPPRPGSTNQEPELRHYTLQQASYVKGRLRLYVRVTDSYGKTIRVLPVGPLVSLSRPEPRVDKLSQLHLLYQDGPHSFSYTVFNLEGQLLIRQTYDFYDYRPRLRTDDAGNISISGGIRRPTPGDFPPPPSESPDEPAPLTNSPTGS